jgi:hypothetical protein
MHVCVRLFCVQIAALRRADLPSKESYRLCIDYETEKAAKVNDGYSVTLLLKAATVEPEPGAHC